MATYQHSFTPDTVRSCLHDSPCVSPGVYQRPYRMGILIYNGLKSAHSVPVFVREISASTNFGVVERKHEDQDSDDEMLKCFNNAAEPVKKLSLTTQSIGGPSTSGPTTAESAKMKWSSSVCLIISRRPVTHDRHDPSLDWSPQLPRVHSVIMACCPSGRTQSRFLGKEIKVFRTCDH